MPVRGERRVVVVVVWVVVVVFGAPLRRARRPGLRVVVVRAIFRVVWMVVDGDSCWYLYLELKIEDEMLLLFDVCVGG